MNTSWNAGGFECKWRLRKKVSLMFLTDDNSEVCVLRCIFYPRSLKKCMWGISAWDRRTEIYWFPAKETFNRAYCITALTRPLCEGCVSHLCESLCKIIGRGSSENFPRFSKILPKFFQIHFQNMWDGKKELETEKKSLRLQSRSINVLGK